MDPNKAYEIGRQGDEQRFRSLIQDALSEGNEAIVSWLLDKVKAAHTGSFKDIIEEAVTNANTESETYKPTDLAKKYWNEYFPEAEPQFEEPETSGVKDDDYEDYTTPEEDAAMEKRLEEDEAARLEEDEKERKHKKLVNTVTQNYNDHPEYMDHFGEEQAEGLSNLLEGLRDTPHDNRW